MHPPRGREVGRGVLPAGVSAFTEAPTQVLDRDERLAVLAPDELERMGRYLRSADRDRFLTAWSLARRVLGLAVDVHPRDLRFDRACSRCGHPAHGKPMLLGGGPDFSLTHSGDRVVVAVSTTGRVGVDVEEEGTRLDDLAEVILHPDEARVRGVELVRVWTRKEAVLKATGAGLSVPMSSFPVVGAHPLRTWDVPVGAGHVAAVAHGAPLAIPTA